MLKRILLPLIAALTLSACTSGAPRTEGPKLIPSAHSTSLEDFPEELPQPKSNSLDDLKANHIETAGLYHRLRERFAGLGEWLRATGQVPDR